MVVKNGVAYVQLAAALLRIPSAGEYQESVNQVESLAAALEAAHKGQPLEEPS